MTNFELESKLDQIVSGHGDILAVRAALVAFAEDGGSRADAHVVLDLLRSRAKSQDEEDLILEALDLVTGFSAPHLRIW